MRSWRTVLASLAFVYSMSSLGPALALTVSPVQIELVAVGDKNRATVTVLNDSPQPLAIEALVQRMILDENGKSQTAKAGDEFLLMPPMALIPPGGTQNFRVQWLGDPMLEASQSFYIFFNQVPVKMPKDHKGVQVVVSMGVIANVAPARGTPSLQVVATGVVVDKGGKRRPTMTVLNPTNVHALLPQSTVRLAGVMVGDAAIGSAQRASGQRSRAAGQAAQVHSAGRGSRQRRRDPGERRDAAAKALTSMP